jgi:hypothetical protein
MDLTYCSLSIHSVKPQGRRQGRQAQGSLRATSRVIRMRLIYVWIPAPRFRGDKLRGNDGLGSGYAAPCPRLFF